MRNKSLKINWGNELKELGYSYKKANHFDKKYKSHWICIDYDLLGYILIFRLLRVDFLNKTKCIKQVDVENMTSLTKIGFVNMVQKIENEFLEFIDDLK